ncbi:DUF3429 domain-containing protein [Sandaracinobacteroides saxicola]|uniref:DUF3429 domain-containing protein n=2 Tax=Sandaracinobacteroides saxicola TaxID=2759707 RepID=A0A7G5IMS8_9SPHN|nr:DUF3429 domain-containing protein [Sandaracinobacteroides saxicola]
MSRFAHALGVLGLAPAFAALAGFILAPDPEARAWAWQAGALYAALIFSFLGGSWWGFAVRAERAIAPMLLTLAVLPTLAALALVMVMSPWMLMLLGGLIIAILPIDRLFERTRLAPEGWFALRLPLSLGLGTSTIALGLVASGVIRAV